MLGHITVVYAVYLNIVNFYNKPQLVQRPAAVTVTGGSTILSAKWKSKKE